MPTKDKPLKPKIKVEEITSPVDVASQPTPEEVTPPTKPSKIASFSQLDVKDQQVGTPAESVKESIEAQSTQTRAEETTSASDDPKPQGPETSSEEIKDWLKEVRPDVTKENEKSAGPNLKLIFAILMLFAVLGTVVGGVFYYRKNVTSDSSQPITQVPTATPAPTSSPTPSENVEEIDLTKYDVNIKNGSGVAGEAGKVKTKLVSADFTEANVKTGNADSYDYDNTEVTLKKDVPEAVFLVISEALKDSYSVVQTETALADSSDYDIEIVVGTPK